MFWINLLNTNEQRPPKVDIDQDPKIPAIPSVVQPSDSEDLSRITLVSLNIRGILKEGGWIFVRRRIKNPTFPKHIIPKFFRSI